MSITITHTPEEGTLLDGDPRPHQQLVKDAGFRWSRSVGWYVRGSRDRRPQMHRINQAAEALRGVGFEVTIEIDETVRPAAEREAALNERLVDRQDALDAKADRKGSEADALLGRAQEMASIIPLGQPILVGHHSEKRDRNFRAKINRTYDRGFEAHGEAKEAERKAEASRSNQDHRESLGASLRRIEKLEADARLIERRLAGKPCPTTGLKLKDEASTEAKRCPVCRNEVDVDVTDDGVKRLGVHYAWDGDKPAAGDYAERLRGELEQLNGDVAYWRAHVAKLEAEGHKAWGPEDFAVGDRVNGRCTVVRINKKSLTIRFDVFSHTNTLKYDAVHSVEKGVSADGN